MKLRASLSLTLSVLCGSVVCSSAATGAILTPLYSDPDFSDQRSVSWSYRYCTDPGCNTLAASGTTLARDPAFAPMDAEVHDLADGVAAQRSSLSATGFHGMGEVSGSQGDSGLLPPPAAPIGETLLVSGGVLILDLDQPTSAVISGHVDYAYSPDPISALYGAGYETAYAWVILERLEPNGGGETIVNQQVGTNDLATKHREFEVSVALLPGRYQFLFGADLSLAADLSDYPGVVNSPASASWVVDWTLPEPAADSLAGLALLMLLAGRSYSAFGAAFRGTPR